MDTGLVLGSAWSFAPITMLRATFNCPYGADDVLWRESTGAGIPVGTLVAHPEESGSVGIFLRPRR
jgi:hypothetical protein